MPVKWCTLPLPIPLLPLWAVQPVQSLGVCTTAHFTFTYTSTLPMDRTARTEPQCLYNGALYLYPYLYSPYGPYGLYRASVPEQRCTLPTYEYPKTVRKNKLLEPPLSQMHPSRILICCSLVINFLFQFLDDPTADIWDNIVSRSDPSAINQLIEYIMKNKCPPYSCTPSDL